MILGAERISLTGRGGVSPEFVVDGAAPSAAGSVTGAAGSTSGPTRPVASTCEPFRPCLCRSRPYPLGILAGSTSRARGNCREAEPKRIPEQGHAAPRSQHRRGSSARSPEAAGSDGPRSAGPLPGAPPAPRTPIRRVDAEREQHQQDQHDGACPQDPDRPGRPGRERVPGLPQRSADGSPPLVDREVERPRPACRRRRSAAREGSSGRTGREGAAQPMPTSAATPVTPMNR